MSHLVEAGYLTSVELFFLIVGHTHNPVDRWFSILSRAIKKADFIGSILAMQALFVLACQQDAKRVGLDTTVIQLTTYRDYRKFYAPVLNDKISNYQLPARFIIKRNEVWAKATMQYMNVSPLPGMPAKWLPLLPSGVNDRLDTEAIIPLVPYMLFNGETELLKALSIDSTALIGSIFDPKVAAQAAQLNDILAALPAIRELEARAIAETTSRMDTEAHGHSVEKVVLSKDQLKRIESEMLRHNNANEGYIIWLKTSQCADPTWLDGVPEVLPNPAKWERLLAQQPAVNRPPASTASSSMGAGVVVDRPPASTASSSMSAPSSSSSTSASTALALPSSSSSVSASSSSSSSSASTSSASASSAPASSAPASSAPASSAPASSASASSASASSNAINAASTANRKPKKTVEEKERDEAASALLNLTTGAANMARAATHMLELDIDVDPDPSLSIAQATSGFTKRVLTQQEIDFYNAHLRVPDIIASVKALVAAAEAEPWELLRLPEETDALKQRKLRIREEQQAYAAKAEANITRLLSRRGINSTNVMSEVLNRDGFSAYLTANIDDMNKVGLLAVAKAAGVETKFTDADGKKKEKKVETLRQDVKAYLAANQQVTVESLIDKATHGATGELNQTAPGLNASAEALPPASPDSSRSADTLSASSAQATLCSIMECDFADTVMCAVCALPFCSKYHATHTDGHDLHLGFLREGLRRPSFASYVDDSAADVSTPTVCVPISGAIRVRFARESFPLTTSTAEPLPGVTEQTSEQLPASAAHPSTAFAPSSTPPLVLLPQSVSSEARPAPTEEPPSSLSTDIIQGQLMGTEVAQPAAAVIQLPITTGKIEVKRKHAEMSNSTFDIAIATVDRLRGQGCTRESLTTALSS